ncbi:DUF1090 family protein [uncultured Helicobacter sp.]|uniref:DUF1090 family protein n=1 Tax=uncultured Helicobacter sp. TaxID=175537 RepID=UPI0025960659|nr:DUF1090 family protein [uncultured Helicobacter sp.]
MTKFLIMACSAYMCYAGAFCDFKIKSAQEGLEAFQASPKKDIQKIQKAKEELESLRKNCKDGEILQEVEENIKATKARLDLANHKLKEAYQSQDNHQIFQAKLQYKIAESEYISAKQEQLRFRDLLK